MYLPSDQLRAILRLIRDAHAAPAPDRDTRLLAGLAALFSEHEQHLVELVLAECSWLREGAPPAKSPLPPQPRAVLRHLLSGASEKETAALMNLSCHTVHQYVKTIYRSYGVRSRPELMARCLGHHAS